MQFSISIVFVCTELNVKTVPFQAIQSSIITQLSPIDKTLSGATTLGQSGPGSDGNEGVLHIPQRSSITGTSPSDCSVWYLGHLLGGILPLNWDTGQDLVWLDFMAYQPLLVI